jgi:hypothetical protein
MGKWEPADATDSTDIPGYRRNLGFTQKLRRVVLINP